MSQILTLNSLYKFFVNQNRDSYFNCKDEHKQIVVHELANFEISDKEMVGMLCAKVKVCHTDMNRNHSFISEETMTKALPTLKYRPVLAYIHQLEDGTYDFDSHNFSSTIDENGEEKRVYDEAQVGAFMDIDPVLEYDEDMDKTYVIAYAAIPEEYTEAANIIRRKNGTKVSAELIINEMSYDAKEQRLDILDFYFNGVTLLGTDSNGNEVKEGMEGSRLDIADFAHNESSNIQKTMVDKLREAYEFLEVVHQNNQEKGALKEMPDSEKDTVVMEEIEEVKSEETPVEEEVVEPTTEEEALVEESTEEATSEEFSLSFEQIRSALYDLIIATEDTDSEWYDIVDTYDETVVYRAWCSGKFYKQNYTIEGNAVSWVGEKEEVFQMIITATEKAALDEMRNNYDALVDYKKKCEKRCADEAKDAVFNMECYDVIRESEGFKELITERDNYSVEEVTKECDLIYAAHMKSVTFSAKSEDTHSVSINHEAEKPAKRTAYAGLFDE